MVLLRPARLVTPIAMMLGCDRAQLAGKRERDVLACRFEILGIAAAEQLVKKQISTVGESHFGTASARGTLAVGLMRAGRDADAMREFKTAIPEGGKCEIKRRLAAT